MIALGDVRYLVAVLALLLAIPWLRRLPLGRLLHSRQVDSLRHWLVERLTPEPEVDQLAADLALAIRRERISRDLARLRRLVATDVDMSATRQLGNRLAYEWLLRELREVGDVEQPAYVESAAAACSAVPRAVPHANSGFNPSRGPAVETLDIGWRR